MLKQEDRVQEDLVCIVRIFAHMLLSNATLLSCTDLFQAVVCKKPNDAHVSSYL